MTTDTSKEIQAGTEGRTLHGTALIALLGALMLTLLLEALDQTIVATALPQIVGSLQGFDRYTWVATAYLLASTTVIPIAGKLSDQFGRKWFFVAGVLVFLSGSLLSGMAQDMNQLIIFRALQGLGAGIGIALVFTAVGDIFPPAERSRWQGIFSGVYGFTSVVGPGLGGWLTDHGPLLGNLVTEASRWRWIFYINLPIGILALIALLACYPKTLHMGSNAQERKGIWQRIDFGGALLAAAATICLLLGLTWGSNQIYDWLSPQVLLILAAAAALYLLFFLVERVVSEPIVPLHLFRQQVFAADSVLALLVGMALLSLIIYLPFYLQGILGESATDSGLVLTPLTLSLVAGSALAGITIARTGHYQFLAILGFALASLGTFLLTFLTLSTSLLMTDLAMIIVGVGLGVFLPMLNLVVQNGLPRRLMGASTGAITYLRALGQTLGVAIVGTVVNRTMSTNLRLPASASELSARARQFATNPQVLISPSFRATVVNIATSFAQRVAVARAVATVPLGPRHDQMVARVTQQAMLQAAQQEHLLLNQVFTAVKQALAGAITNGLWCILVFCLCGVVATLFLKNVPLATEFRDEPADEVYASSQTAPG